MNWACKKTKLLQAPKLLHVAPPISNIWCTQLVWGAHRPHFATLDGIRDYTFWSWELGDWYALYPYVAITPNYHPHRCVRPSILGRLSGIVRPRYVSSVTISCVPV